MTRAAWIGLGVLAAAIGVVAAAIAPVWLATRETKAADAD